MNLIPARWCRPVATTSPELAPEVVREAARRSDRVFAPRGEVVWICQTPSGAKTAHDHEWQARNRAALTDGAVWYPVTVESDETMEESA